MNRKSKERASPSIDKPRDDIPPGATKAAADRPIQRRRGAPGSAAGPRHATNDPGSVDETYGAVDSNDPLAEPPEEEQDPLENGPPYAGISGGAIGGTPAGGRTSEGERDRPLYVPASHRGDSTIGSKPVKEPKPGGRKKGSR